jgi:ATP-binding cassette subfamily D (ALD) long-chain fatty acid import protein
MLSIYVANLEGSVVKAVVNKNKSKFFDLAFMWLAVGIPACGLNSLIRYLNTTIAMLFRKRLTSHYYSLYMENGVFYKVGNLDDRLQNPDQCLTDDTNKFSEELANVLSNIGKPIFDLVLFIREMLHGLGRTAVLGATATAIVTGVLLHVIQPAFGYIIARKAQAEGELRFAHVRLITNAEEVAFQRGEKIERGILEDLQRSVRLIVNALNTRRAAYNVVEGFLLKYVWGIVGLLTCAVPIFYPDLAPGGASKAPRTIGDSTEAVVVHRKLMAASAEACERLMESLKDLSHLAGFANRLTQMLDVFDEVHKGQCVHTTVQDATPREIKGKVEESVDTLEFHNVPIVAPNGELLIPALTFTIKRGQNLLVTGPNGSGKSSLFRILSGLWPVVDGVVRRPLRGNSLYFLPQRPYLVVGTFRDQIIYPHSAAQCTKTDTELLNILKWTSLEGVMQREGWDRVVEWKDILSGGEKQKVGMARLMYHCPMFAVLDECTSAVSVDVEGEMYAKVVELGITIMSVSHRRSIWKYHSHSLTLDGHGGFKFGEMRLEEWMSLTERKSQLIKELSDVSQALGEDAEYRGTTPPHPSTPRDPPAK